ncbi:MAG: type IV toxin-antitoxin system AbiEi family antitoxin domain-containing protein [Nocardioidaceae bacterium]|nr:type IV toxin-antitoxin system AbiEi family antitoxin domain-containing protein [Nocardioidaceae bacterium]
MDELRLLATTRHYFLRRDALRIGVSDEVLHRGVKRGRLARIRQGAYCHLDIWRGLDEGDRFLARSLAAYDLTDGDIALSHTSALARLGCPLHGVSLDRVHLTFRGAGTARLEAGTSRHFNGSPPAVFTRLDDVWTTTPSWTAIGAMTVMPVESCVVAGDWLLHHDLTTAEELWDLKTGLNHHPKTRHLEVALRLLDGKSESPGESRCRYLFWLLGLPCPKLQWPIRDRNGTLIAVTDFAWPEHNTYGEFDGKIKYGRLLKPGQEPGDVVFDEKRREDAIRRVTSGTVVRWTWQDIGPYSEPVRQLRGILGPAA